MTHLFRSSSSRLPLLAFLVFFALSLLTRLALCLGSLHDLSWNFSIVGAFAVGVFFDVMAGLFAAVPWVLYGALAPERFLKSRAGRIITGVLMICFTSLLIFISVSEWVFWDEFGARFNFIAVDYLIWTHEVFDNITESYPMGRIFAGIALLGVGITWLLHRKGMMAWASSGKAGWIERCTALGVGLVLPALAGFFVNQASLPGFANQYNAELSKNGCWSFFAAFKQMELNYEQWYQKLPESEAIADTKKLLVTANESAASTRPDDLRRSINVTGPEHKWNVILVCMESMSGSYMTYGGNQKGITPVLDRLATQSLFFDNLYATGTRTVRGMEAITLNLPPTPGMSIIYRPEGKDLVTTFTPFLKRGYECGFFYGGDGRFDYMNRYFSTAGCRIMDVNAWNKNDVTFKTAWGACDEDLFNKVIAEADKSYAAGKPFHDFCMTTSNHRPFDFPGGRIDLPSHSGKNAAVKYSDWAIGDLIDKASKRPWFKETLFVIVSDHCASSAGKSDIDVTKFHIPAMVYNPGLVPAKTVSKLCSQIDLMPTVFGLLNWDHDTLGYGHDLLAPSAATLKDRAFISNYQKIALLQDNSLAILKPKRETALYSCDIQSGALTPMEPGNTNILHETIAYYQSASWLFGSGKLKAALYKSPPAPNPPAKDH